MILRQFKEFYFRNRFHCDKWFFVKVRTSTETIPLYKCKGEILDLKVISVSQNLIVVKEYL